MPAPFFLHRRTVLGILGTACAAPLAKADDKPLRIILPMAPGSVGDSIARALTGHLSTALKRVVLVDNQPGAGGMTGTAQLARATGDGATLALVSSSHVINPFIYKSMPYDAIRDVTPITVIGKSMMVLVTNPSVPAETLAAFIAQLKANPGKVNYGSSGNGGVTHLPAEMFNREAQVVTNHIPYKGLGPQITDTVGGVVEFGFVPVGLAAPLVKAGKLRALAITGAARSPKMPDLPTLKESGLASYVYEPWLAIIGPRGLTQQQVQTFYREIRTALTQQEVLSLMDRLDMSPVDMTPDATLAYFRSEMEVYGTLVKNAGIQAE